MLRLCQGIHTQRVSIRIWNIDVYYYLHMFMRLTRIFNKFSATIAFVWSIVKSRHVKNRVDAAFLAREFTPARSHGHKLIF